MHTLTGARESRNEMVISVIYHPFLNYLPFSNKYFDFM